MQWKLLIPAVLLVSAAPAAAGKPVDHVAGWSIYRNESNCSAYSAFVDNALVGISYDASDRSTRIVFTNSDADSLTDGDARALDIYLKRADGSLDDHWRGVEFTVGADPGGGRVFVSSNLEEPALSDFKNAMAVVFFYKDRKIAAYDLAGTAAALGVVERCSMRVHNINPKDVFADQD